MPRLLPFTCLLLIASLAHGQQPDDRAFQFRDVFELEYASDPQLSPDGTLVVYVRNFFDIMQDRARSNLWMVRIDGTEHRPLTTGVENDNTPRWSPDGRRLAYVSRADGKTQLYCRWMDTGQTAQLTHLTSPPKNLAWSPDGKWLAFSMHVPQKREPLVKLPEKPPGAQWAEPFKVIDKLTYRFDGKGYLKPGYHHLFVVPSDGGSPRQLTAGDFDHQGTPSWTPDSKSLIFSANRNPDWEYQPRNSEVYELRLADRSIRPLTARDGPDSEPVVSPDGRQIAYVGFDDKRQGYQVTRLYLMDRNGENRRVLTPKLDRDVQSPVWARDGSGLYFQYDDQGNTRLAVITLQGEIRPLAENVGGTTLGRPYASGSFSHGGAGLAFTQGSPQSPADVAYVQDAKARRLTALNEDLLGHKKLGALEEFHVESSADARPIHAWLLKPPDFEADKKYPLILEIHGGPFANYGPRFSAEMQWYAAAGYLVVYVNPRGSTSYGQEFGNLIHHAYPGQDYDDLMSAVDAVVKRGIADEENLFVTGGSGGGVLSSWTVGKTDRFRAAVVCKPVINWYSFVLTSDAYPFFSQYWFPGFPWEHVEHYHQRSPISLVGNVTTPTMLITGEEDHRTPISETEQFYQALKLRKIETVLVRVPGASHGIAARPSHMMSKAAHVLQWFEMHRKQK